jgi:magnesium chelatase family protein
MALARTYAMALAGVEGHVVEIEADIENGLVALLLVGLPDTALREARDRIRSAIINSQHSWPQRRITVGLSPASLPKRGSGFDLGIAVAILSAAGVVPKDGLAGTVFLGELGLDGRIRPVAGILPSIAAAAGAGFGRAVVAVQNAAEAALVPSMRVISAAGLGPLIDWHRAGCPGAGRCRPAPRLARAAIWPTWSASRWHAGQPRSVRPAAITCCCWGPQERERRCWRSGCRRSCRGWRRRRRSR